MESHSKTSVPLQAAPHAGPRAETDPFLRQLLNAMLSFSSGDFSSRMPTDITAVSRTRAPPSSGFRWSRLRSSR